MPDCMTSLQFCRDVASWNSVCFVLIKKLVESCPRLVHVKEEIPTRSQACFLTPFQVRPAITEKPYLAHWKRNNAALNFAVCPQV